MANEPNEEEQPLLHAATYTQAPKVSHKVLTKEERQTLIKEHEAQQQEAAKLDEAASKGRIGRCRGVLLEDVIRKADVLKEGENDTGFQVDDAETVGTDDPHAVVPGYGQHFALQGKAVTGERDRGGRLWIRTAERPGYACDAEGWS